MENREKLRARKKTYYEWHKERIMRQHREYIARNEEAVYLRLRDYRRRNKAAIEKWWAKSPRGRLLTTLVMALRRRPTENPVTIDDLMAMFDAQKGRCAVTGVELVWRQGKTVPESLSIDRIDSSLGYIRENCRLICYQANAFKNRWSDEQMVAMARAIVATADAKSTDPHWQPYLVHSTAA